MAMLRAIVKRPDELVGHMTNVSDRLETMQKTVGGWIETVTLDRQVVIVCNEEGRIRGMQPNPYLSYDFVGDWFLCGRDGEEFTDIPPLWLVKHMALMREARGEL